MNQKIVQQKAHQLLGNDIDIYYSTRKNKKYMVLNPQTNKWIHFGDSRYEDFTQHQDEKRRTLFRNRNAKWANAPKWTPSFLSYYLLW